jgi:hypothetical protein
MSEPLDMTVEEQISRATDLISRERNEGFEVELIVGELCDYIEQGNDFEIPVSRRILNEKIYDILENISNRKLERKKELFHESIYDYSMELKRSASKYEFVFPLRFPSGYPTSFKLGDIYMESISDKQWEDYVDQAIVDENGEVIYEVERMGNSLNDDPFLHDENSFWTTSVRAHNLESALRLFSTQLETVLGIININYFDLYSMKITKAPDTNSRRTAQMGLYKPPCYLVFQNNTYLQLVENYGEYSTREFKLNNPREFQGRLESVPAWDLATYPYLTEQIMAAYRAGHRAVTYTNFADMYLGFWRALESLALTRADDDSMKDVIQRTIRFSSHDKRPAEQAERLRTIRNDIVHQATGGSPSTRDILFLKDILASTISALHELQTNNEYSARDIHSIITHNNQSDRELNTNLEQKLSDLTKAATTAENLITVLQWRRSQQNDES